jgi:hypothetical protein
MSIAAKPGLFSEQDAIRAAVPVRQSDEAMNLRALRLFIGKLEFQKR